MLRRGVVALLLGLNLTMGAGAQDMESRRGSVFGYQVPAGWRSSDTANGVDMSAPDGSAAAYALVMTNMLGHFSAQNLVDFTVRQAGYSNIQVLQKVAPSSGAVAYVFSANQHGMPVIGYIQAWAQPYYGTTYAEVKGFHTLAPRWQSESQQLAQMAQSVHPVNNTHFAHQDLLIPAPNIPYAAVYGDNNQTTAANRDRARQKASQDWHDATMGETRQKDPATGGIYTRPLETYNGARGGYVNPARPNEILQPAKPGE